MKSEIRRNRVKLTGALQSGFILLQLFRCMVDVVGNGILFFPRMPITLPEP
ncbi:MAG: hypothetical protein HOI70_02165 [Opitutae bacterium]|nr:hypothetical protein [Opitutae bacterium]